MRKILDEYQNFIFGSIVLICFALWIVFRKNEIEQKGVYAIAKIIKYRGEADGESLFIDIHIGDKVFSTVVSNGCSNCIGNFFYVKILKEDPSRVILYLDSPVPDCIIKQQKIPEEGWKEIPKCK